MRYFKDKAYFLAKKYSPKVGLDLPYFLKGGFWLGAAQVFTLLKAFIFSVLFANLLSKEAYGQYNFIISILSIAMVFSLPGMGPSIVVAISKNKHGTYFKAMQEILKWSILGSFVFFLVAGYGYIVGKEYGGILFILLGILFPLYAVSNFYNRFYEGIKKFNISSIVVIIFNIFNIILMTIIVYYTKKLIYIIIFIFISQIIYLGYFGIFYVRKYINNKKVEKSSISFGKKYSFFNIFMTIALHIDSLFIAYFLGFEELAIFSIVVLIPNHLKSLFTIFTPLIIPKISNESVINKKEIFRHIKKFLIFSIIIIFLYSLTSPFIFKYFYPKYEDYFYLSIFFNFSFISTLSILFLSYFIKERKSDIIKKVNIYSSIVLVCFSFLFIFYWGILGAIIARVIYRLFYLSITYFYMQKISI